MGHPIAGLDQRLPSTDPRKGNLDAVLRSAELNLLLKFYRGLRSIGNPSSHRGLQQFRFRKRLDLLRAEAENANRPGNVLDGLLAEISEGERQLIPDLIVSRAGDAQAAWLAQRLQPGSDIDAVAENVITIDDDVANVDADAEDDASILRYRGVAARHGTLDGERAADRIDHAPELDKHAIARRFDDTAAMPCDRGVDELTAVRLQHRQGADLVGAHQPTVQRRPLPGSPPTSVGCPSSPRFLRGAIGAKSYLDWRAPPINETPRLQRSTAQSHQGNEK